MTAPRIMIVTASRHQAPLILKAKAMGYEVLATDADQNAPSLALADHAAILDASDTKRLLRVARDFRANAIVSEQTDVAVPAVAYVAEQMGLPGVGHDTALRATDKWRMREACRAAGLPGPRFCLAQTADAAVAAACAIGLPVIVKPADNQASRGVTKVIAPAAVAEAASRALAASRSGRILVEELMIGKECSVESFVMGDAIEVLAISEKTKCPPPYSYDLQLIFPGAHRPELIANIKSMNAAIIRAVGIRMGFAHLEMMITPQGPRMIEIAARGSGARVATDLLPALTGIDLLAARLRQALGEDVRLPPAPQGRLGILRFFELQPGRVQRIGGLAEAASVSGVVHLEFTPRPGDIIGPVVSGDQRPGFVLATGDSRAEIIAIADRVTRTINVEMA